MFSSSDPLPVVDFGVRERVPRGERQPVRHPAAQAEVDAVVFAPAVRDVDREVRGARAEDPRTAARSSARVDLVQLDAPAEVVSVRVHVVDVEHRRRVELVRPADRGLVGVGLRDARRRDVRVERQRAAGFVLARDGRRGRRRRGTKLPSFLHDAVDVMHVEDLTGADAGGVDRREQDVGVRVADIVVAAPAGAQHVASHHRAGRRPRRRAAESCSCLLRRTCRSHRTPAVPANRPARAASCRITKFGFFVWSIA